MQSHSTTAKWRRPRQAHLNPALGQVGQIHDRSFTTIGDLAVIGSAPREQINPKHGASTQTVQT